jgi:hypothetical protein
MTSRAITIATVVLFTTCQISVANDASTFVSLDRLNSLEAEIAELQDWRAQWATQDIIEHRTSCTPHSDACGGQPCGPQVGIYGGAELLFLKPYFANQIPLRIDFPGGFTRFGRDFDYDYTVEPRVWLGYALPCGWGVEASYWYLDQTSNLSQTITGGFGGYTDFVAAGRTINVGMSLSPNVGPQEILMRHKVELEVLDGLITYQSRCKHVTWQGGFGIRYAYVEQSVRQFLGIPTNFDQFFEGVGPAGRLTIRGDIGYGCVLDGRLGGCVLFGDDALFSEQIGTQYSEVSPNGLLSIGEVALGVQKTWDTSWGEFYGRAGWEGQIWFGAGNAVNVREDLALQGFTLALGLRR